MLQFTSFSSVKINKITMKTRTRCYKTSYLGLEPIIMEFSKLTRKLQPSLSLGRKFQISFLFFFLSTTHISFMHDQNGQLFISVDPKLSSNNITRYHPTRNLFDPTWLACMQADFIFLQFSDLHTAKSSHAGLNHPVFNQLNTQPSENQTLSSKFHTKISIQLPK